MKIPETRYADVGGSQIAYQVFGEGPALTFMFGFLSHLDFRWEDGDFLKFMRRLSTFSRVILFDRRGSGASDPLPDASEPSWQDWVDDIKAVLDGAGIAKTALLGSSDAGPAAMLFAATYPERVTSLVLTGTAPRITASPEYPYGISEDQRDEVARVMEDHWGRSDGVLAGLFVPEKASDVEFVDWYARLQRASMTPRRVRQMWRVLRDVDATDVLPLIQAPTLVVGLADYALVNSGVVDYMASRIPNARTLMLKGSNGGASWLNEPDRYLGAIEEHILGHRSPADIHRVLATVLFTDISGSTERATELGDGKWREVLDRHDSLSSRTVARFSGRLVKLTGDGILATFDGPARAVQCAAALLEELSREGITLRTGLHAGEVELRGDDVSGIAVNIAARVMNLAAPGEVWVSGTVKDLVVGSRLNFESRGMHVLKGAPNRWSLYAYTGSTADQ